MFVNKYQINLSTIATGTTATTINIPINMDFQMVDQSELIEREFVQTEVENAINPILDYEKVRFAPININGIPLDSLIYNLNLSGATNYGAVGFTNDDIKFGRESFKRTFLNLAFYDTPNALEQKLVTFVTLFSDLDPSDLLPFNTTLGIPGQPKPANQIPLRFTLSNPLTNPLGYSEGFNLYDFKDEFSTTPSKYLYMRASFKNAKTGKEVNLMVDNVADTIDNLVNKLYTRYRLYRGPYGYYYTLDTNYHGNGYYGPNNVSFLGNNATINLFQIKAL